MRILFLLLSSLFLVACRTQGELEYVSAHGETKTASAGNEWTFEYATKLHNDQKLTDKEYGYIIAYIDLGLNTANK